MVVELSRKLEELGCFMGFLSRGVPDGLVHLSCLGSVLLRNLPRHMVDQGAPVNFRVVLKHAFIKALLDDLSDGRLWESAGVDLLLLSLSSRTPLDECRLQSDLDEAVVLHLVNSVGNYYVEDGYVPRPKLVQLVSISVSGGRLDESRL